MTLIGQTIKGYRIQSEIGKGGFGAVYLAEQETVGRQVAIKVILPEYANDPEFQRQFEIEARLVATLEHPHVIPLYDYWQDESGAYLVMRYVSGGTLEEFLRREEALSWEQVQRIMLQVTEALEVAHDSGVIHRDIKPANILMDERENAYLTDFGLAWIAGSVSGGDAIGGTISYLAPELIQGESPSTQSDLYALGIILYQLLTGVHPFEGNVSDMIYAHVETPVPSILEIMSDLPEEVDDLIFRLTSKDPDDRYKNAKKLVDALRYTGTSSDNSPTATISMRSKGTGLDKSQRQRANTLKLRNRYSMIDSVYNYWIEGVLEDRLSGYALLDLHLHLEPDYVSGDDSDDSYTQEIADSAENILHIFQSYNGKLLILGDAGVGKSTLVLTLTRELLYQANEDDNHPIPVIFNLSSWSGNVGMGDWIQHELNEKYQVPASIANRWIENDSLLLILDGLDEVSDTYRQNCMDAINQWRDEHSFVDVIVSCRTVDYMALSGQLNLNGATVIQPLSDEQVIDYLTSIGTGTAGMQSMLQQYPEMRELSHSPLMLGVMLTAYQDVTMEKIPDMESLTQRQNYLFDRYVELVWQRRAAEKQFSLDEIRSGFSNLASKMYQRSQSMFFVEDLQPDWLTSPLQKSYNWQHQILVMVCLSLAWCVSSILFLEADEYLYYAVFGAIWGWILFFGIERMGYIRGLLLFVVLVSLSRITLDWTESVADYFEKSLFRSTLPYTLILAILAVIYRRSGQISSHIRSVDKLYFSFASLRWIGAVAGACGGFLVILPDILSGESVPLIEAVLKIGIPALLAWLITGFRSNQLEQSANVNEKIHRSFRNGLNMGLVGAVVVATIVGIAFHPRGFDLSEGAPALFNILPFLVTAFFVYGGMSTLQHYLLRRSLTQHAIIPSRLIPLLKEGVQLGIVRRVGGGFIFIHRYLLEYFAGIENSD